MTMADERTRSLRFGWEFLMELSASDCLTAEQRKTVDEILLHYPTGAEIKQWAKDCEKDSQETAIYGWRLAPEKLRSAYFDTVEPVIPDSIERGPTTPQERAYALRSAYEFFRFGLMGSKKDNLPERLRRQIPYVLRHFPEGREINSWALSDERVKTLDPNFKQWLSPEVPS